MYYLLSAHCNVIYEALVGKLTEGDSQTLTAVLYSTQMLSVISGIILV